MLYLGLHRVPNQLVMSSKEDETDLSLQHILSQNKILTAQSEKKKKELGKKPVNPASEITDSALLASMASRLHVVEKELLLSKKEVVEKV